MESSVYFMVAFNWDLRMTNSAAWAENPNFSLTYKRKGKILVAFSRHTSLLGYCSNLLGG